MTDDVIAIHEAGHSFVAVAVGLRLRCVRIGDRPCYDLAPGPTPRIARLVTLVRAHANHDRTYCL